MSSNSGIEWTSATWNPIAGCTPVSPGCLNCYAATMSARLEAMGQRKYTGLTVKRDGRQVFNGRINFDEAALSIPLNRKPPTVYFVNSMSDLFHADVPDDFINRVFEVMEHAQRHTYQILTKRADRMAEYVGWRWGGGRIPCRNIWLGVSVEGPTQTYRIDAIRDMPARVRFLSVEPLLADVGRLDLRGIHWVIVGGESGHEARECRVEWVRDVVSQCAAAGVPVFVKQLGAHVIDHGTTSADHYEPDECWPNGTRYDYHRALLKDKKGGTPDEWPANLRVRQMPDAHAVPV